MLLPVSHVLLDQSLIEANHALEQVDRLLTVVDFSGRELVHRGVVCLELACLEEWNSVLDE